MRSRIATLAATAMAVATVCLAAPASANACSNEESKWLQALTPTISSSDRAYGAMTTQYVYTRNLAGCGSVANTTFIYLSSSPGLDFLETGTRQTSATGASNFVLFYEYHDYPADVVYMEDSTVRPANRYVSLNVSNWSGTSYEWKAQYSFSGQASGWVTLGITPAMVANRGYPLSEISRYGDADAIATQQDLKYRTAGSGWTPWVNMICNTTLNQNLRSYDATKLANDSWQSRVGTPPAGDC